MLDQYWNYEADGKLAQGQSEFHMNAKGLLTMPVPGELLIFAYRPLRSHDGFCSKQGRIGCNAGRICVNISGLC